MANPPNEQIPMVKPDAGAAFRAEMWATNMLMGYWWVLAGAVGAILAGTLIYGYWQSSETEAAREMFGESQAVERQFIETLQNDKRVLSGEVDVAVVAKNAGEKVMGISDSQTGVASEFSAMMAAEYCEQGEDTECAAKGLERAAASSDPVIAYSATSRLVILQELPAGDAEAKLRSFASMKDQPWVAQSALYDIGRIYQSAGDTAKAREVFTELQEGWDPLYLTDAVDARLEELGTAPTDQPGAAPTPEDAE